MTTDEFTVQGVPVSELAQQYGTPLFVYDTEVLRAGYQRLRERLHPAVDVLFSLKANPNVSVCAYLRSLGAGAEVSSLAELMTARRAGVDPKDTIFLGPGKSAEELTACLRAGLHAVVCESLAELKLLDALAVAEGLSEVPVMLRMNPDFHTKGSGLAMGGKPRQFGVDLAVLRQSADVVKRLRAARVIGVHAYMGTRFLDHADVLNNTTHILAAAEALCAELGVPLRTVDFGGGLGVPYFDGEKELDLDSLLVALHGVVDEFTRTHPETRLIMELGRYLTAMAGTYVVRVLYVKESMGETFAVADGGTNHHMAAVGVGSFVKRNFPIRSLTRYTEPAVGPVTVTGPLCTPNDVLGKRVQLPPVEPGDLLGVERSGAYGPTASPVLFLSHGYPAEVLVHDGEAHLVARRDTPEDLLNRQILKEF
ncbi:diaminopimelate decarboxylase [Amycolatopsis bartoniae]|uniref:Diaminopimelate decarboxylase n=1 Tax=Amycolatopsis bartoniae TaxID=941986 RepID=A0A8H9MC89_9PSEU|nr:type III PLP-dependent enzyme [Amycolatopsis bartoniae]MBB2938526.1 diaminopimelate decarboxylase [Amycolatopsis bartoniae]TVT10333.1 type III PLP-dependent enzyme [Amycolatopsis bartoniae]GHF70373.1 diaminopimelate decarboxylase [Amycolatopsis bartoniae]